jgi:hypothetical protein
MADLSKAPPLSFSIDTSQMESFAEQLKAYPKALRAAVARAVNTSLKQGKRESARLISEKYNIKQADVIDGIVMHRAKPADTTGKLTIHPERRPGLAKFGAKQVQKKGGGVTYKTLRGKGKAFIPGAFAYPKNKPIWVAIQNVSHINKGGNKDEKTAKRRTRLKFLQGITVWGMFASVNNQKRVVDVMQTRFSENMRQSVNFEYLVRTGQIPRRVGLDGFIKRGKPA